MKTSAKGVRLICEFEGFRSEAYLDPVGIPTIGYGFIEGVSLGDTMTQYEAQQRMSRELVKYERGVMQACKIAPNQNQFDALVCFAFNVGVAGMAGSSVIKAHNRGDKQAAARAFGLWTKAGGKVWAGLTRRRSAESALYLEPISDDVSDPEQGSMLAMPQKVDAERPMAESQINKASVVAGASAAVAAISEVSNAVGSVRSSVQSMGDWFIPVVLVLVVALCGYVVYQRWLQRFGGWA